MEFWSEALLTPGKVYTIPLVNGKNVSGIFVKTLMLMGEEIGHKDYIFSDNPPSTFRIQYRPTMGRVSYKEENTDTPPVTVTGPATDLTFMMGAAKKRRARSKHRKTPRRKSLKRRRVQSRWF